MQSLTYALDTTWRGILKEFGLVPADVLRRAGLADDLLQQPAVRLPAADYYRLWNSFEAATGDPFVAIRLCESLRSETFSPPIFAALCSPNLLVAARRLAQYKTLIGPMRLDVRENSDRTTLEFTWLDSPLVPPASFVLMELLFCVSLIRMGTREQVRPLELTTTVLPPQSGPYEAFVGIRLKRGASNSVTFSTADAKRPFLTTNEPLWEIFEPALRQRLADLDASVTTAARVRAALHEAIPSGLVTMEAIADKLALSKRTLQRRIEAEGTNYQQILKETREALARHYLERTALPTTEISFLLGFDEPNSFYRAFRQWTGTTPDNVRHAQ